MPGVVVTTGAVAGPSAPTIAPSATYFAVGLTERGQAGKPTLITSFAQFEAVFGQATSYSALHDDIKMFFAEGGSRAYCQRVVGASATTGTLVSGLQDRNNTPATTLNVAAKAAGAWSTQVTVKVLDGATSDTFRFQIYLSGLLVKDYTNLHSPQEAVSRINGDATNFYVVLSDAGSASTAPANNPIAISNPVALSAGTDDRGSVVAATYVAALANFDSGLGDGAVSIPGLGPSVHAGLITHADTFNRLAILVEARTADKGTLEGTASTLNAKRAGLFAPWVVVPDSFGGTKTISPEGYVAAARARAHNTAGPWQSAAGEVSKARYVLAPSVVYSSADGNELDGAKVNAIRTVAGAVRVYGWRSLSSDTDNWSYLKDADVVNRVVTESYTRLEPYLFSVIDAQGHLQAQIAGTLEGIVLPMAAANGLFPMIAADGTQLDPGYKVNVGDDINSVASLAQNQILAVLGIRISPTAAMVFLTVTKAAVTAAL
jgi:hypothetical protein